MDCPKCGLINPDTAQICDCGYNFGNKEVIADLSRAANLQVRPWIRYWARLFDMSLFSLAIGVLMSMYLLPNIEEKIPDRLIDLFIIFLWVFVEALFLFLFGMTPGKWLFNIKISRHDNSKLSWEKALERCFMVWWRGLGIGFGPVTLFTLIFGYHRLTKYSITSWDRDGGFIVQHNKIGALRILAISTYFILLLISIMFLFTADYSI